MRCAPARSPAPPPARPPPASLPGGGRVEAPWQSNLRVWPRPLRTLRARVPLGREPRSPLSPLCRRAPLQPARNLVQRFGTPCPRAHASQRRRTRPSPVAAAAAAAPASQASRRRAAQRCSSSRSRGEGLPRVGLPRAELRLAVTLCVGQSRRRAAPWRPDDSRLAGSRRWRPGRFALARLEPELAPSVRSTPTRVSSVRERCLWGAAHTSEVPS